MSYDKQFTGKFKERERQNMNQHIEYTRPTIRQVLHDSPWTNFEEHLNDLKERVDNSVKKTNELRIRYREELIKTNPDLVNKISRPSSYKLEEAKNLLLTGTVAASDGTISHVPLLGGSKIQVGVVIVFNKGEVVDYITKIFEAEITQDTGNAIDYFQKLRGTRKISNLLARAIMLYGERRLLLDHRADWRMMHGEILPHELRTGAGRPQDNLQPAFDLVYELLEKKNFIAASEASDDIDILNAAILLEPGEFIVIKDLTNVLTLFLDGDEIQAGANFNQQDKQRFREFIQRVGPQISIVLVKAGNKPFILECHKEQVEEAVSLFLADSLWTRGFEIEGSPFTVRGFPYHIDLADQIARTLIKGSEFQTFVESRLFDIGIESGFFDIDPRLTRI
ncbi:hypothetical protein [Tenuifilum osseticum]|uniref:hypothetical protein n=1 Tax=Tenuifilum osseticum TaxID=3374723 RepID=UPI0034E57082